MRALYISHNGMLESLGQAQVLPYLRGLAQRGIEFDLFSFELPTASDERIDELRDDLERAGIHWTPLRRARDPRLRTKIRESTRGVFLTLKAALQRRPRIVHGRSYLPTAIADVVATSLPHARLVFDCRGMLGDEYIDAGYWTEERLEYRLLKRYEARAFRRSEGIVVLTDALKRLALVRGWVGERSTIEAIPCCVDTSRFRFDRLAREAIRQELALSDRFVVVYSGSLGGWYQEKELAAYVGLLQRRLKRRVAFLVLTLSDSENLLSHLKHHGVSAEDVIVKGAAPQKMPAYLSAGDLALSFIKSCFSKTGSSPTKVAEYLACGLPVVLNGDIGDQSELATHEDACVVLRSLSEDALIASVPHAIELGERPLAARVEATSRVVEAHFALDRVGVSRYERLYQKLAS